MNPFTIACMVTGALASNTAQTAVLRLVGPGVLHALGAIGIGIAVGNIVERETATFITNIAGAFEPMTDSSK